MPQDPELWEGKEGQPRVFSRICCATLCSDLPRGSAGPAAAITSLGAAGPAGNFSKHQLGAVGGGELKQGLAGSERSQLSLCLCAGGILDLSRQFPITPPFLQLDLVMDWGQSIPGGGEGEQDVPKGWGRGNSSQGSGSGLIPGHLPALLASSALLSTEITAGG